MKQTKIIEQEIESLTAFLGLVQAYEEIAAMRMRKVKESVLARRKFMDGLNDAFSYVAYAYKVYKSEVNRIRYMKKDFTDLDDNGKIVSVYLSANTGLYGDLPRNAFKLFMEDIKNRETDLVIVGSMGRGFYEGSSNTQDYQYFDLSDSHFEERQFKKILDYVSEYAEVYVYHGIFKDALNQEAGTTNITGELEKIKHKLEGKTVTQFICEPDVEYVAKYFENQINSLLFEQTIFESSLSKYASRMFSLNSAADNIDERLGKLNYQRRKIKHKKVNASIQSSILRSRVWNKH